MAMFESLSQRLDNVFRSLGRGGRVTEADVKAAMKEVRMALLEADVALPVVKDFVNRARERALGAEVHKSRRADQEVITIVHDELIETLGEPGHLDFSRSQKPHVIMIIGLQGSGKTTSAAKLALYLRKNDNRTPFLVAADTYRPAAVDQVITLAKQIGVEYYEEGVSSKPEDIAKRGLEAAKQSGADVVIIDTAGRLQIDDTLMSELEEIKKRTKPAEVLLVADAMTGQEAVNIASGFNERVGITGLVLTKVDGDARGGAALSMRAVTGVPIKFIGTGEKISDDTFEAFRPQGIADRILGMGDIVALAKRAEELYEEDEALRLQQKMLENQFTLQDFLDQLQKIKSMGPITKVFGMLPGFDKMRMQGMVDDEDIEGRLKKVEAIINSMTIEERNKPKILNASRRKRIARGSGVEVRDVNDVIKQYRQMQKMMDQLRKGRFPKIPGMPNLGF